MYSMFNVEPLSCSHSFLHTVQVSILMTKVDFETKSSLLFFFFEFIPLRGCDFILETMFTLDLGKRFDNRNRLNHSFLKKEDCTNENKSQPYSSSTISSIIIIYIYIFSSSPPLSSNIIKLILFIIELLYNYNY